MVWDLRILLHAAQQPYVPFDDNAIIIIAMVHM